eukprot:TRINITY_DN87164_c0_g1_i1.p1 TRINITY_DN87164_c0_g1~~TRINITY_DN87164_c0_g1_i1.p1  ORF type:complete len:242 (-),score=40.36 TRINITY_DN87164_c0_g1_i1:8-709(-)
MEAAGLVKALSAVNDRVSAVTLRCGISRKPRLVAVSKLQPVSAIQALYAVGHRDFGENYVQELIDKAEKLPSDIRWHFIGHLQSNKVNTLVRNVRSLAFVETVDSVRLARALDSAASTRGTPLQIFLQVNTSEELTKSGVDQQKLTELATFVSRNCSALSLRGLMTIGAAGDGSSDFRRLAGARQSIAEALGLQPDSLELSMGMSQDFELAVEMGSTNIRVGSTIFGARPAKT